MFIGISLKETSNISSSIFIFPISAIDHRWIDAEAKSLKGKFNMLLSLFIPPLKNLPSFVKLVESGDHCCECSLLSMGQVLVQ